MAVNGWGVTSLVAANIAQAIAYLVLTGWLSRTRFSPRLDRAHARRFLTFGGTVTVTSFLEFLQANTDTVSVSRWIGASGLGQYTRATYLVSLPVEQVVAATTRVLLPTFSRVQNDRIRFARGFTLSVGPLAVVVMVPVAMVSASSPALVEILLGPGWGLASSVLPIVGVANGLALLTNLPAVAAESLGEISRKLVLQLMSLVCTIVLVGFVVLTGPTMHRLALAWMCGELIRHALYWLAMFPTLGVSRKKVARRYGGAAFMAAVAAAPLWVVVRHFGETGVVPLLLAALVGGLLTIGSLVWLPFTRSIRIDLKTLRSNMTAPDPQD
jgi:O-antigen/teichoic acid export membrane protein